MTINYDKYKKALEEEKVLLEKEMSEVGRKNPDNPKDWEALPAEENISLADENVTADKIEDYEDNAAILNTLENRYNDIKVALEKIKNKTYGLCQVCHKEIDEERLTTNPSSETCREHMV